jgi:hypothetical protein
VRVEQGSTDPRARGDKPPFPRQEQVPPGEDRALKPQADHGEETYRGLGRLAGKVALITGGDSGIGKAVAIAYAREGAHVAFSYLAGAEQADADDTVHWIEQAGVQALAVPVDLSRPDDCRRLVEETVQRFGRIDILVNNAAFQGKAVESLEEFDAERIRHTFAVNIEAMFHICREAVAHLPAGAAIVNTSSIQAFEPSFEILDYATTKAAIYNFTKGLSRQLLERGIRVNAVAPGPVWTPLIAQSFDEEKVRSFGQDNPMERPAQPVELAPAYVFLASDESRFITGEVVGVTGGRRLA